MRTGIDLSGYSPDTLHFMVAALERLLACLDERRTSPLPLDQFQELLQIWGTLRTNENREGALEVLRAFVRGHHH